MLFWNTDAQKGNKVYIKQTISISLIFPTPSKI